jgi:uncharacterized protein (TIGR04141 family)
VPTPRPPPSDSAILKSLTGKVLAEHKSLFKYVTGSNTLLIRSEVQAGGLIGLCKQLLTLCHSQDCRNTFPDIENIVPVRDPVVIDRLNERLTEGLKERTQNVVLDILAAYQREKLAFGNRVRKRRQPRQMPWLPFRGNADALRFQPIPDP